MEDMKLENKNVVWELMNRLRGRIPAEQLTEFFVSYAYNYCNNEDLIAGDTELLYESEEILNRIPNGLKIELKTMMDELTIDEIRSLVYELLLIRHQFADNSSKELIELAYNLLKIEDNDSVFDLGSGLGSFLAGVNYYSKLDKVHVSTLNGLEINHNVQSISRMAMELIIDSNSSTKSKIVYSNILTDDNHFSYNKGFVFPPLGIKIMGSDSVFKTIYSDVVLSPRNTPDWIFIDRLLKNLKGSEKRAFAITTGRALFNAADKDYREYLVKQGLLEGVIELPQCLFDKTNIKLFALVFSTNNENVKLFDASAFVTNEKNNNSNSVDVKEIISFYWSSSVTSKSIEELSEFQNWIPSTVLIDIVKPKNGVKLSEVSTVFTGSQYTIRNFQDKISHTKTNYQLLTSGDIQDGTIDVNKLDYINNSDIKLDKHALAKNDVVITSKSSKVKIAVIDFDPTEKIIVTGGMIIVRPNTSMLNPTYLKIFLESEQGQRVLKSIQKGMTIVTLNSKELAEIMIPLPPIDHQYKMAKKFNSKLSTLWALKSEIETIENDIKNFYNNIDAEVK
jgi:type I restriction-modification system DNA methylase subunit